MSSTPHQDPNHTRHTIAAALHAIPAALPRDEWVKVGMALKSELNDSEGFALFDEWSATADGYNAAAARSTWRSIKPGGGVSIGSLFHLARQHGFELPKADAPAHQPNAEEREAQARARREAAKREERERIERQRKAAAEAARLMTEASAEGSSHYLERKRVQAHGCRFLGAVLLVPLHDASGELWNVQRIMPIKPDDGGPDKLLLPGSRKAGLHHWCGDPEGASILLLAEGYATAASVHEASGIPCAMSIDAGNLEPVARALRGRFPKARIFIAADDDRPTQARTGSNPGREKAEKAAALLGTRPIFPAGLEGAESDFNDLHVRAGLDTVAAIIHAGVNAGAAADLGTSTSPAGASGLRINDRGAADTEASTADEKRSKARRSEPPPDDGGGRDAFEADDSGVWRYVPPGRDGGDGGWRRVCDPLSAEALARDSADGAASLVLGFRSLFGQDRRLILPLQSIAGDGGAWRGMLADAGFPVPPDAHRRRWLGEYLATRWPEQHARLTERTGWHGRAYVLPTDTIGGDDAEPVLFVGERMSEGGCSSKGEADRWRFLIARHCGTQSRLAFAVSCAFAGPLLAWAGGLDSGGFHLVGDSSCGKTTAARVAASVWGGPGFMQRWRGTDNGIEAIAAAHSDLFLILDELAQLDPKAAGEASYMLGNGSGKVRAGRAGGQRPRLSWRLLFLSAGEVGLSDHMAEAGKRSRAGQELRLVDLPADAGKGFGVFDHRGEFGDSGELARHLADACGRAFGTVGRQWLEHLAGRTESLSRELRERMAAFERQAVPETASGQVQRVARRFAIVASAGEMATAEGFTGWEPGQAQAAALRVFNAWIESRPAGIGASETAQMLRQVKGWFESHGEARFTDWDRAEDNHRPQTMNRAGWRRRIETNNGIVEVEAVEWLVLPEVFRSEIAKGWTDRAVLRLLDKAGHLRKEKPSAFTCSVKVPGLGRAQVIRIRSTLLDEHED
jgi:putative DNA primase/helicase